MKKLLCIAMTLMLALSYCACGSGEKYDSAASENMSGGNFTGDFESASPDMPMEINGNGEMSDTRKLIKNFSASVQTLEYDAALEKLEKLVEDAGGYIESSSMNGSGAIDYGRVYARSASFTLRIPAGKADSLVASLSSLGAVTNSSHNVDDVTDYYYDIEAHLTALRAQETRLLELLAEADSVDTMITIESALTDVRYQIESLDGTKRRLDSQIEYSRVDLYIDEVFTPEEISASPRSLGERIAARFKSSMSELKTGGEDFIVFFLGDIVIIAMWGAVIFVLVKMYKKSRKKLLKKPIEEKSDEK